MTIFFPRNAVTAKRIGTFSKQSETPRTRTVVVFVSFANVAALPEHRIRNALRVFFTINSRRVFYVRNRARKEHLPLTEISDLSETWNARDHTDS